MSSNLAHLLHLLGLLWNSNEMAASHDHRLRMSTGGYMRVSTAAVARDSMWSGLRRRNRIFTMRGPPTTVASSIMLT